jgi:hypothetical protein
MRADKITEEEAPMRANFTALTKIAMALLFLGVAFAQGGAVAESSDMEKVKAASQAFMRR